MRGRRRQHARNVRNPRTKVEVLEPRIALSGTPYQDFLQITEIMYNPPAPTAAELLIDPTFNNDDFEFIELYNSSTSTTLNLAGVKITAGPNEVFDFAGTDVTSLGPRQYVLVVNDLGAFRARYGRGLDGIIADNYSGNLANGGEPIILKEPSGADIHHFTYDDAHPWPLAPDGYGFSLNLIDPNGNPDHADGMQWTGSGPAKGTPGAANVAQQPAIVINEILSHTDPPDVDRIELYNPTTSPVHVGGWFLSDDSDASDGINATMYKIPNGTWVAPYGYGILRADDDGNPATDPGPNYFGSAFLLSSVGEDLYLVAGNGTSLTGYSTSVRFGAQLNGESLGRYPDATGPFYPMVEQTFGSANSARRIGPVLINEVMYDPPPVAGYPTDLLEFVEIVNPTDDTVLLTNWVISEIGYAFPAGATIGPGQIRVVVPFNPVSDATAIAVFELIYGVDIPASPQDYLGPYPHPLSNNGQAVTLWRADLPPADQPDVIPLIPEDLADYDDQAPWPTSAGGLGDSLHRATEVAFGDEATSWLAAAPTPGRAAFALLGDVNLDGAVDGLDVEPFVAAVLSGLYQIEADVNRDGAVDGLDVEPFVAAVLTGGGVTASATTAPTATPAAATAPSRPGAPAAAESHRDPYRVTTGATGGLPPVLVNAPSPWRRRQRNAAERDITANASDARHWWTSHQWHPAVVCSTGRAGSHRATESGRRIEQWPVNGLSRVFPLACPPV